MEQKSSVNKMSGILKAVGLLMAGGVAIIMIVDTIEMIISGSARYLPSTLDFIIMGVIFAVGCTLYSYDES